MISSHGIFSHNLCYECHYAGNHDCYEQLALIKQSINKTVTHFAALKNNKLYEAVSTKGMNLK